MQSAGQAAAHSEQPTHFSRPVSSNLCNLCRPRKRGYTGVFSSGYWTVTGFSVNRPNVVIRPRSVSTNVRHVPRAGPGAGVRWTWITSSPGLQAVTVTPPTPAPPGAGGSWGEFAGDTTGNWGGVSGISVSPPRALP